MSSVDGTLLATFPCCCSHGWDMTHLQQAAGDHRVGGIQGRPEQGEQDCSVGWFLQSCTKMVAELQVCRVHRFTCHWAFLMFFGTELNASVAIVAVGICASMGFVQYVIQSTKLPCHDMSCHDITIWERGDKIQSITDYWFKIKQTKMLNNQWICREEECIRLYNVLKSILPW